MSVLDNEGHDPNGMGNRPVGAERQLIYAYEDDVAALRAEIEQLRAALVRIDAINDNPAVFNSEINALCDPILRPQLKTA